MTFWEDLLSNASVISLKFNFRKVLIRYVNANVVKTKVYLML